MNRMIVAVFDNEEKAFEGLSALKALHKDGDISLYGSSVINKNELGEVQVKDASNQGPVGTAVGMLSGAFIGIIGGLPGMAIGASAGALGGMFFDMDNSGIEIGFVDEVSKALSEGKTAVVAEVDEGWTTPVDSRMEALDAMVYRRNRSEVVEEQLDREAEATMAELDELEAELEEAGEEASRKIQNQIEKNKAKLKTLTEYVKKKNNEMQEEVDAKSDKLNKQIQESDERRIRKLDKRMATLMKNYETKKAKLSATVKKISESLS